MRGKGYMTEAGKAVLDAAKADGVPYVTATHDILNPKSGNLLRRLGMTYRYTYDEKWLPKDIDVTFRMYQINLDGSDTEFGGYGGSSPDGSVSFRFALRYYLCDVFERATIGRPLRRHTRSKRLTV